METAGGISNGTTEGSNKIKIKVTFEITNY